MSRGVFRPNKTGKLIATPSYRPILATLDLAADPIARPTDNDNGGDERDEDGRGRGAKGDGPSGAPTPSMCITQRREEKRTGNIVYRTLDRVPAASA
jgi:hypothetical protein